MCCLGFLIDTQTGEQENIRAENCTSHEIRHEYTFYQHAHMQVISKVRCLTKIDCIYLT